MKPLEQLEQIRQMFFKIQMQQELIDYYDLMSNTLGGCDFSSERIDKSRNLDAPFVKWIYKKIDAEKQLKDMEVELQNKISEAGKILSQLSNKNLSTVLTLRYCCNLSWSQIAEKAHYSVSSVRRYYKKAVEELENLKVEQG